MRQIEKDMLKAIANGCNFRRSNTEVEQTNNTIYVYLFGYLIFVQDKKTGEKMYNLRGWNTVTTRSRLNALGASIRCKNFTAVNYDGSALIPAAGDYGKAGYFIAKA